MTVRWSRWIVAGGIVTLLTGYTVPAAAEWGLCAQMQADFIALDRAAGSAGSGGVDGLAQQVDSARSAARRAGCQTFLFFGPPPSRNCPAIMARLDQLERAYADAGGGGGGGGFFGFGRQSPASRRNELRDQMLAYGCSVPDSVSGSYRTLCVRTCDGYYFPISYATNRTRFKTDAAVCQSMYPPGEAALYVHHTTGEDATQAVSALTGEPLAKESFAFAYRSGYDHACAALFRSGSGALISFAKPPVPDSVVEASMVTPVAVALPRRGKQPKVPDAAATGEMPANLDPGLRTAEASGDQRMTADGVRTVGPAYYYEPSYLASTGGEPPKLAKPDLPDPPVVSTDAPPVAASILPNPLNFFRKHKPAATPPPEPDAEPDQAN
jgi:hypothetical protein